MDVSAFGVDHDISKAVAVFGAKRNKDSSTDRITRQDRKALASPFHAAARPLKTGVLLQPKRL